MTNLIWMLIAGCLMVAISFAVNHFINWSESGEKVESVAWLPVVASDVSFLRTNSRRIFEFQISEVDFLKWAKQYDLSEIREPFHIQRFNYDGDPLSEGQESVHEVLPSPVPNTIAVVTNGLKYHDWTPGRGGVSVCFDRSKSRAYFHAQDR